MNAINEIERAKLTRRGRPGMGYGCCSTWVDEHFPPQGERWSLEHLREGYIYIYLVTEAFLSLLPLPGFPGFGVGLRGKRVLKVFCCLSQSIFNRRTWDSWYVWLELSNFSIWKILAYFNQRHKLRCSLESLGSDCFPRVSARQSNRRQLLKGYHQFQANNL